MYAKLPHIPERGCRAHADSAPFQVYAHNPVAGASAVFMVYLHKQSLLLFLLRLVRSLAVLPVIIVGVRIYTEALKQPAQAVGILMVVNEPVFF